LPLNGGNEPMDITPACIGLVVKRVDNGATDYERNILLGVGSFHWAVVTVMALAGAEV